MRIKGSEVPQADRLERVIAVTLAVANGARTDLEISGAIGERRDGRYYRRAAENLGFITNHQNDSHLTERGSLIVENPTIANPVLISSVLQQNVFQILIPFLEVHRLGVSRLQVVDYLAPLFHNELAYTTVDRRTSSMLKWLLTLGLIEEKQNRIFLSHAVVQSLPIVNVVDTDQPILPATGDLREYEIVKNRLADAAEVITIYKDLAKMERANGAHVSLVNLVASRITAAGGIAKSNQFIDLASKMNADFLFEMKSTTDKNVRSQVRKGISQLYEYRYLENTPDAKLVLVVERPIVAPNNWMNEYLENDRDVLLVWDGEDRLFGSAKASAALPFLHLNR
jgi:hypothetical protein